MQKKVIFHDFDLNFLSDFIFESKLSKIILKDRMRLHKLYMKLPHMVSIFIEIFDVENLVCDLYINQGNTVIA